MSSNIFQKLANLKEIDFGVNKISNLDSVVFPTSLEKMDFSSNQITHLNSNIFQKLANLKEINFMNNKITSLNSIVFPTSLVNMSFSGNPIKNEKMQSEEHLNDPVYCQKQLTAWIASQLVNSVDPIKELDEKYSKYNHGIKDYVQSIVLDKANLGTLDLEDVLTRHIIFDCQSLENKRFLVVAVSVLNEEKFANEFYKSIDENGAETESSIYRYDEFKNINKAVVHHASRIPIRYIIDEWCRKESDTEIVFTGVGFGAAIAAFLAVRLFNKGQEREYINNTTEKFNQVLYIGFGCPLFSGSRFKIVFSRLQHRFHYYRHEADLDVVKCDVKSILKLLKYQVNKGKISINMSCDLDYDSYFSDDGSGNYSSKGENIKQLLNILQSYSQNDNSYTGFGFYYRISEADEKSSFSYTTNLLEEIMKITIIEPGSISKINKRLVNSISDYFILAKNFENLKLPKLNITGPRDNELNKHLKMFKEGKFEENDFHVSFVEKQNETDVILYSQKMVNLDSLFCIFLTLNSDKPVIKPVSILTRSIAYNYKNCIKAKFSISKHHIDLRKLDEMTFVFCSFYDQKTIIKCFNEKNGVIKEDKVENSTINSLTVDVLYIHAILFIQVVKTLIQNDKILNELFKDTQKLVDLLSQIEEISKEEEKIKLCEEFPNFNNDQVVKTLLFKDTQKLVYLLSQIEEISKEEEEKIKLFPNFNNDSKEKEYKRAMFKRFGIEMSNDQLNLTLKLKYATFQEILTEVGFKLAKAEVGVEVKEVEKKINIMKTLLEKIVPKVYNLKRTQINAMMAEYWGYNDILPHLDDFSLEMQRELEDACNLL